MANDGSTYLCVNAGSVNEWGESDIFSAAGMYLMWHFCNKQKVSDVGFCALQLLRSCG